MARYSTPVPARLIARLPSTWLVGKKVRLRPVEVEDVALLQRWRNAPGAQAWLYRRLPFRTKDVTDWAARASMDPDQPGFIIQTHRGTDIGTIGLRIHDARAELGIAIYESRYWSRGYGQDAVQVMVAGAFRARPLQRIELTVFPDNRRAIQCYLKAGFKREGVLRSYAYRDGRYTDCVIMSILHDEWMRRQDRAAR